MRDFDLSPDAEEDIWSIWQYLAQEAGLSAASRVQSTIFDKIGFLAKMPGMGHWRRDITDEPVKFFLVYSYLIVYRPEKKPLQVVAILHSSRDVAEILRDRL
ncbi:MAG TPA: type II toxin-antitoxin system RelE/ParE family toxin [Bryobacteraceae bacterium]|jgi:plasmid stabilization system protein ParE|nr:type II toxin-antitoxin system RelE/ParE family toxin [Bryobacteraceae bacterium]